MRGGSRFIERVQVIQIVDVVERVLGGVLLRRAGVRLAVVFDHPALRPAHVRVAFFVAQFRPILVGSEAHDAVGRDVGGIEQRLVGLAEGAHETLALAPDAAFGPRNPDLLQRVSLALLREHSDAGAQWSVGDIARFPTPDRTGSFAGVLCEMGPPDEDWAVFDFNHPLAGVPLQLEVRIIGVL